MGRMTERFPAIRVDTTLAAGQVGPQVTARPDTVVVEEPLELRVDGTVVTTTMRTPGDDFDLALGWLHGEGVIARAEQVRTLMHCLDEDESGSPTFNVVDVALTGDGPALPLVARAQPSTSACGVCGTARIDLVKARSRHDPRTDTTTFDAGLVATFAQRLRPAQRLFARTGGVHAAALMTPDGDLHHVREDIGRHNAVDKVIGAALRAGQLPLRGQALVVTSRASFEIAQKAWAAGIPLLAAVSAPSSMAIAVAQESGMSLAAFCRDGRMTVYAGAGRLGL